MLKDRSEKDRAGTEERLMMQKDINLEIAKIFDGQLDLHMIQKNRFEQYIRDFSLEKEDAVISVLEKYQLEQSEYNRDHSGVNLEEKILSLVRNGDLEGMKKYMLEQINVEDNFNTIGIVARQPKRRMEYLYVTLITIASRAAVAGGADVELCYALSDIFLQELESAKTLEDMYNIPMKASLVFTAVAKAYRERASCLPIEKCKEYIAKNLRKPFKIGEIGPAIGVNSSYLSKIFTKNEGMTIQQYVMRERCEHAANLLRYSDYEISEISEYFCFATHSHFGAQFKKVYGMTPNEYRKKNHRE